MSSVPNAVIRARLARARDELHELENRCADPGLSADLSAVLDVIEQTLIARFGWRYPEPLTEHDRAFLAAAGAL